MKTVLFIDDVCYKPYNFTVLATEPLGGTEATVLRTAKMLAKHHNVYVLALGGKEVEEEGIKFITKETAFPIPDTVIHIRSLRTLELATTAWPRAKNIVWMHDLGTKAFKKEIELYERYAPDIVFVSDYHKQQFIDMAINPYSRHEYKGTHKVIHNYVEGLSRSDTSTGFLLDGLIGPRRDDRLLFASSPHKGLKFTLEVFKKLQRKYPKFELAICNPGYYKDVDIKYVDNVTYLGELPHHRVLEEMRQSLCLFQLNHIFPETFGLVYGEANACGLPVVGHKLGALHEFISPDQFCDTHSLTKVIDLLLFYKENIGNIKLDLSHYCYNKELVLKKWLGIV